MDDRLTEAGAAAARIASPEMRQEMIAVAAYYHAQQRGFAAGDTLADWLAAEAQIDQALCADSGEEAARQRFLSSLSAQLGDWDVALAQWRDRAAEAKLKTRNEVQKQIDSFTKQRAAAEQKLLELREHSADAWHDLKEGVDLAWQEMRNTLDRIAARFK